MKVETYTIGQIKHRENVAFGEPLKAVIAAKYIQAGQHPAAGPTYRLRTAEDSVIATEARQAEEQRRDDIRASDGYKRAMEGRD